MSNPLVKRPACKAVYKLKTIFNPWPLKPPRFNRTIGRFSRSLSQRNRPPHRRSTSKDVCIQIRNYPKFELKNTSHQQNTFRMKKAKLSKHIANMSLVLFSVADIWSLNKRDSQGDLQWCSVDDSTGEFLSSKAEFKQVLVRTRTVSFQKFLKRLNLLNELSNRKSLLRVKNWQKLFKGMNFEHMKNILL